MLKTLIGTSGFSYKHWGDGVFYPEGLARNKWFEYYCQYFNTVELNVTFYRLPDSKMVKSWKDRSPEDFTFVLKGSRYITHIKKLGQVGKEFEIFRKRVEPLDGKMEAVLWQLPPKMKIDKEGLEDFLKILPKGWRNCFEFRDRSWFDRGIYNILEHYKAAICLADWPFKMTMEGWKGEEGATVVPQTADFVYIRRHGPQELYGSDYTREELLELRKFIDSRVKIGEDVLCYFNNDAHGFAVKNALELKEIMGIA